MDSLQIARAVMDVFEDYRMLPTAIDKFDETGRTIMAGKILEFVYANKPILFSMLGYPFKSPNHRDKTFTDLPDLAEESSLRNLHDFATRIRAFYEPGAMVSLVSDGFAFNDEFRVADSTVDKYAERVRDMSRGLAVRWFGMRDFYREPISQARQKLLAQWAPTDAELERRILTDPNVNWLYRGMLKFMELESAIWPFDSGMARRRETKATVRRMMILNEAYSALMAREFADHIRLSMHKSDNSGTKYSFQLIPGKPEKIWTSPWHSAIAIDDAGELETIHRRDAEAARMEVIAKDGQPYFYRKVS